MPSTAKCTPTEFQRRDAQVVGIDAAERTVELAFSSEAEVYRPGFGIEILSHGNGACDLSRLNDGGALLADHDRSRQIGVVEKAWVGNDYVGRATVRFSRSAAGREALQDVIDGIRKHVSMGYQILELKDAGVRDGDDVYLVTRWQPTEISIVSIPADTSVGIGRSASAPPRTIEGISSMRDVTNPKAGDEGRSLVEAVRELVREAKNATGAKANTPPGFADPIMYVKESKSRSLGAMLGGDYLPSLFDANGKLVRTPQARPSAVSMSVSAAVCANSRVVRAGAGLVILPEAAPAQPVGRTGAIVMQRVPAFVRNVEAAPFAVIEVGAGAQVETSPSPIATSNIDPEGFTAHAVRFEVSRRERLDYSGQEELIAQIVASITLGLARAADSQMLSALEAASLQSFTLADAASADLRFDSLRALVGTDGNGAEVAQDGVLRAAGVPGALTADTSKTFVGDFSRAAIVIRDDVQICAESVGLDDRTAFTVWAGIQSCIPATAKFFAVAP